MSGMAIRERTTLITRRFYAARAEIANGSESLVSVDQIDRFERLASGTIYLLRDNKAACVRAEEATHANVRNGARTGEVIDLGFDAAKREIDAIVTSMIDWKTALREARTKFVTQREAPEASKEFLQLASMYQSGVLTTAEFEVLKNRLDASRSISGLGQRSG